MKKGKRYYKKFEKLGLYWLNSLNDYNLDPFNKKDPKTDFCLGELYYKLIRYSLETSIPSIENCISQQNGIYRGKKSWKGKLVFNLGKSPVVDFLKKEPNKESYSIEEIRNDMLKVMKQLDGITETLDGVNKEYKINHPDYGWLNAEEWYIFNNLLFSKSIKLKQNLDQRISYRK